MTAGLLKRTVNRARRLALHETALGVKDALNVTLLIALMLLVHLGMPGPIPSGADGGNWLALARERLGAEVMAADVTYPPLVPLLLSLLLPLLGPIYSLVVVALIAKCLFVVAVYGCVRPVGSWYALLASICLGAAGGQLELYAWGGYPQLLGTPFALMSVYLGVRWLDERRRMNLAFSYLLGFCAFATHRLIAGLLLIALPAAMLHWLLITRAKRREWVRAVTAIHVFVIPGVLVMILSTIDGAGSGVTPVLNPFEFEWLEAIEYTIRDAPLPWALVSLVGLMGLSVRRLTGPRTATLAVGSSWSLAGLSFFIATGENRSLLLTQVGLIMMACLAIERGFRWVRRRRPHRPRRRTDRIAAPAITTLVISMTSAIVAGGLGAYSSAIDWYQVADEEVLEALDWLKRNSGKEDLIAASAGPNGNPLGWWVQGYGERQTYTGVDVRFLSFPDERTQADIANEIFAGTANEAHMLSLTERHGVDFLILDRRGPSSEWLEGEIVGRLRIVYESPSIAILEVASRDRRVNQLRPEN